MTIHRWTTLVWLTLVGVTSAGPLRGQSDVLDVGLCARVGAEPIPAARHSGAEDKSAFDSVQAAIDAGRATESTDARQCLWAVAETWARVEAEQAPNDVEAQYRLALTLGLRADVESGRVRVALANELFGRLERVLSMDPEHPDALHVFGRLHAGVMRMGRVTRFLATRLMGGDALREASWEEAERLLESAAQARPEVMDYHYELGRLYEDTDRNDLAVREAEHVLALQPKDMGEAIIYAYAHDLLERTQSNDETGPRSRP